MHAPQPSMQCSTAHRIAAMMHQPLWLCVSASNVPNPVLPLLSGFANASGHGPDLPGIQTFNLHDLPDLQL